MHIDGAAHPYSGLHTYQYWRKSVSSVEPHLVDPVTNPRFTIDRGTRVAAAGSCFAQHIARSIGQAGYNVLVTEDGGDLAESERAERGYGFFPARFGNIYTTIQLLQLFEEAFGERPPLTEAWERPDGRFVDPVRQQVDPAGFESPEAVQQDRQRHLTCVRRMFEQADLFVFTLGLTEAWRMRSDGTVLSSAPGVVAGAYDPASHEFVNFSVEQTFGALQSFLDKFHQVNPQAKVLLTVSPVPLIATYEDRSVLSSTTVSKAVLRVAADMAIKDYGWVDYFPAFEIITGSSSGGMYFEDDHRAVNALGVAHAVRCFMNNYTVEGGGLRPDRILAGATLPTASSVLCDEDILETARS
tara:strand:- start:6400 stop:7467 length:1068 start_codon:yes stop_codon:yes gene_type:complete